MSTIPHEHCLHESDKVMTIELVWISALTGGVGASVFVAAIWSALESFSQLSLLQKRAKDPDSLVTVKDIMLAVLHAKKTVGRAIVVLLVSAMALVRLASPSLLVTGSTYVMFTLLLLVQIGVGWFVWLDVKERIYMWSDEKEWYGGLTLKKFLLHRFHRDD